MRLGRRFYIALVLIVLLMGIGYVFAPFFAIGQWALFVLAVSALVDGVMLLASNRPQSSSKVITKATSLLTECRMASSFLEAHGPMKTTFAWGCSFFTIRAVATIGVNSWEMFSIISGKNFFAIMLQEGQQEVRRNGSSFVTTLSA